MTPAMMYRIIRLMNNPSRVTPTTMQPYLVALQEGQTSEWRIRRAISYFGYTAGGGVSAKGFVPINAQLGIAPQQPIRSP